MHGACTLYAQAMHRPSGVPAEVNAVNGRQGGDDRAGVIRRVGVLRAAASGRRRRWCPRGDPGEGVARGSALLCMLADAWERHAMTGNRGSASGIEADAFSRYSRNALRWSRGSLRRIKRQFSKRMRQHSKREIRRDDI